MERILGYGRYSGTWGTPQILQGPYDMGGEGTGKQRFGRVRSGMCLGPPRAFRMRSPGGATTKGAQFSSWMQVLYI